MSVKCVLSACFQGRVSETWSYFLSVCPLRPMSDGGRLEILCCTCTSRRSIHPLEVKVQGKWKYVEGGDKWVMSKLRWTNFLRQFLDIFERVPKIYPPSQQKPFFLNQRVPPLDFKKYFFQIALSHFSSKAIALHLVSQFKKGITLGYWKYF